MSRNVPHNLSAERALIAAMLMSEEARVEAAGIVTADHFYDPRHKCIVHAMLTLHEAGVPVDPIVVADRLLRENLLDVSGGEQYLAELVAESFSSSATRRYAEIVLHNAIQRDILAVGERITDIGYENPADLTQALDRIVNMATGLFNPTLTSETTAGELVERVLRGIDQFGKPSFRAIPTGLPEVDRLLGGGLQPGKLYIIGGRPGSGKSSLGFQIAAHAAFYGEWPTYLASLEMSGDEVIRRMMSGEAQISDRAFQAGDLRDHEWERVNAIAEVVRSSALVVDDNPSITPSAMRSGAARLLRRSGADRGLVVVDYLQLMVSESTRKSDNRATEVGNISRALKILSRWLDVPVVALSQLSREIEKREDKRPKLSDLRDSGSLEQDADVVIFVHRPWMFDSSVDPTLAEIIVAKQRGGPTGIVETVWHAEWTRFLSKEAAESISSHPVGPVDEF